MSSNKTLSAEARSAELRRKERLAVASHVLNANVISWNREAFMSSRKAVLRSLYLADLMMAAADEFAEGTIDGTDI